MSRKEFTQLEYIQKVHEKLTETHCLNLSVESARQLMIQEGAVAR